MRKLNLAVFFCVAASLFASGSVASHVQVATGTPQTTPTPTPTPKPGGTATTNDPACDAAAKAGLKVGDLAVSDVCNTVVEDFKDRPEVPNPPRQYTLSVENKAFVDNLRSSIRQVRKKRYKAVVVNFAPNFIKTEDQLRTAIEPAYTESTLGVWLDRVNDHGGIYRLKTSEAVSFSPEKLLFDWVGKPVLKWLINTFFKKDPYADAKRIDAYVVSYATGANAGSIRRICFVQRGMKIDDTICSRT